MDLHAVEDVTLEPGVARLVPTGLTIEVPSGYEAQVRPRSGLALKHAITIPNAPGTIDPGIFAHQVRATPDNQQVILITRGHDQFVGQSQVRQRALPWEQLRLSVKNNFRNCFRRARVKVVIETPVGDGLGRSPEAAQIRHDDGMIAHQFGCQRCPHVARIAKAVEQHHRRTAVGAPPVSRVAGSALCGPAPGDQDREGE